jgi:hypothetical protein
MIQKNDDGGMPMRKGIVVLLLCLLVCMAAANALGTESRDRIRLAKEITLELFRGDPQKVHDIFAPEIVDLLSADDLAALVGQLTDEEVGLGAFQSLGEARQGDPEIIVTARLAASDLLVILTLTDDGLIAGLYFLPDSARPEDIPLAENEEEVVFGALNLPGILTAPEGEKLPAVVLVHGSGANDRNESLGGTYVFKDIAEGLSEQGIAVLRYDKRTYLMNMGVLPVTDEDLANLTVYEETVPDAIEAVQFLKNDPRIDPERIFIIGHSQGAIMAPTIHNDGADVGGLILLAGTLRSLPALLAEQLEAAAPELFVEEIALLKKILDIGEDEARQASFSGQSMYMFWEAARYDLKAQAEKAGVPMLILQGSEDQNVYADRDYPLWEAFQKEHPDRDITLALYDGLDHFFLEGANFSSQVLGDIAAWIKDR